MKDLELTLSGDTVTPGEAEAYLADTPAAAPPNRLQSCVFTRKFPLRIKKTK
jgi:hypothetical protein